MSSESIESKPLSRGTVIAARYEIEKYLGESLLGPTYVVKHIEQQTFLVLRFIRKSYKSKDEFESVQKLIEKMREIKHPNMIRYGNMGIYQDSIFFTQEYFRSENLRAKIIDKQNDKEEFSIEEAFAIATKILDAVIALHNVGIYHTTIKPENILVRDSSLSGRFVRQVKLNDVLTAAILGEKTLPSPYRAPECRPELAMNKEASAASDIFSVGIILYELLVGKPAKGTYLPPSQLRNGLSIDVDKIINQALSFQPEDRYPSAKGMQNHIRNSIGDFVVEIPQSTSNRLAITALSATVVLLLSFLGYLLMLQQQPSSQEKRFEQMKAKDETLLRDITAARKQQKPISVEQVEEMNAKVEGMRYVPAGPVAIGVFQREYDDNLTPKLPSDITAHMELVGHYYIDQFEYPNKPPQKGEKPEFLSNITQSSAAKMCAKEGKRLCTSTEWEKACRGPNSYIYSYGNTSDSEYCNKENYGEKCQSDYGVYGMSSDAAEWTSSISSSSAEEAIIKGGDVAGSPERRYRCSNRVDKRKTYKHTLISFRCCKDVDRVLAEEEERKAQEAAQQDTGEESQ